MTRSSTLLVFLPILTACATVFHGTSQAVSFVSEPPGATVTVDSVVRGVTPLRVSLARNSTHTVRFDLAGHDTESRPIEQRVSPLIWTDLAAPLGGALSYQMTLGTILGPIALYSLLDVVLGGGFALKPDSISVRLTPKPTGTQRNGMVKSP